jgi:hypothetical protein
VNFSKTKKKTCWNDFNEKINFWDLCVRQMNVSFVQEKFGTLTGQIIEMVSPMKILLRLICSGVSWAAEPSSPPPPTTTKNDSELSRHRRFIQAKQALVELLLSHSWHAQTSRCIHSAWLSLILVFYLCRSFNGRSYGDAIEFLLFGFRIQHYGPEHPKLMVIGSTLDNMFI